MPDYFVSTARGNDATGAGTATNPWKTIGKAIGSSPAITLPGSGTTKVYIEPGVYYESVTLGLSPTSGAPLELIGDCDGAGFLAGGYGSAVSGVVDWSAWSDDATVIAGPTLTGNAASYVTMRRLKILGGNTGSSASCLHVTTGSNWTLLDSVFVAHVSGANTVHFTTGPAALNLTVERCDFYASVTSAVSALRFAVPETASEYDMGSVVRNCRFFGGGGGSSRGLRLDRISSTSLGKLGAGLSIKSCTFFGLNGSGILIYTGTTIALTAPLAIQGCLFVRCSGGIEAGATTQVAEDYNALHVITPRTSVSVGANSTTVVRPALSLEDRRSFEAGPGKRPYGAPDDLAALKAAGGYSAPSTDRFGRTRSSPTAYGAVEALDDAAAASNAFDPLGALLS